MKKVRIWLGFYNYKRTYQDYPGNLVHAFASIRYNSIIFFQSMQFKKLTLGQI